MSRLDETFAALRRAGTPGLVTYVTAGDPDHDRSRDVLLALDRGGADVIEVGVPFSDPLADGPVIQRASERALLAGMTLTRRARPGRRTCGQSCERRSSCSPTRTPSCGWAPRPLRRGRPPPGWTACSCSTFRSKRRARRATCSWPPVSIPIFLVSPTTTPERIALADELGRGFLYVISRLGVTGVRAALADGIEELTARVRAHASLPLAVGFGLSRPEHVAAVGAYADAAVVGSALVERIATDAAEPDLAARVEAYIQWLKGKTGSSAPHGAEA